MKKRIGFVGLGLMGSGMAENLLAAAYPVIGYDVDQDRIKAFVAKGGRKASSPGDPGGGGCDHPVAPGLLRGERGRHGFTNSSGAEGPDLVLIDTTTADPVMSAELATRPKDKGLEMPTTVSGTSTYVRRTGRDLHGRRKERTLNACQPIFPLPEKRSLTWGRMAAEPWPNWSSILVLGLNRMVLAEGLCLAGKGGDGPFATLEVSKKVGGLFSAMDMKGVKMIEKDFLPRKANRLFI